MEDMGLGEVYPVKEEDDSLMEEPTAEKIEKVH